jgi:hypothetical protein
VKPQVVLTFGGAWADLFEASLAKKLAGIVHLPIGNPRFQLTPETLEQIVGEKKENADSILERINSSSRQASEILFRLSWFMSFADMVFIDCALLDTAIGHQILIDAQRMEVPTFGVGVDNRSSPLAAAFLKAIVYPSQAEDLVRLVLQQTAQDGSL